MASLITDAHSSLSTAFCRYLLTLIFHRFFSVFFNYLILGLPILLLIPSNLLSNIFLALYS